MLLTAAQAGPSTQPRRRNVSDWPPEKIACYTPVRCYPRTMTIHQARIPRGATSDCPELRFWKVTAMGYRRNLATGGGTGEKCNCFGKMLTISCESSFLESLEKKS